MVYRAALTEIDGDPSKEAEILRIEYRALLMQGEADPNGGIATGELPADPLRRRAIGAARGALLALASPKTSATMPFISSRKSSTAPN